MLEPVMVEIPEGFFKMGTDGGNAGEAPRHEVFLPRYEIALYPVTNRHYESFLAVHPARAIPLHWDGPSAPGDRADHPVVNINWDEATAYAGWLGQQLDRAFRLPTEAEWENAARGGDGRAYPWGTDFDAGRCNVRGHGPGTTTAVDRYPGGTRPCGAMDMAGNVAEWCSDWHRQGYASERGRNPLGPSTGEHRVVRGGSWRYSVDAARCAARYWSPPEHRRDNTGFRLAAS